MTFGLVWIIIVVTVYMKPFVYQGIATVKEVRKEKMSLVSLPVVPEDTAESFTLEKRLKQYVSMYLPNIYTEENVFKRIVKQIVESHFLYDLITSTDTEDTMTRKYLKALKIVTHLSGMIILLNITTNIIIINYHIILAFMFFLTMLYSLQYPVDDNTCHYNHNKDSCLHRHNFNGENYCEWSVNSTSSSSSSSSNSTTTAVSSLYDGYCDFNEQTFSLSTVMLLTLIQLLLIVPVDTAIEVIFEDNILAPTKELVEEQLINASLQRRVSQVYSTVRRASSVLRRASVNAIRGINAASVRDNLKEKALTVRSTINISKQLIETRDKTTELLSAYHTKVMRRNVTIQKFITTMEDDDIALKLYQDFNDG